MLFQSNEKVHSLFIFDRQHAWDVSVCVCVDVSECVLKNDS